MVMVLNSGGDHIITTRKRMVEQRKTQVSNDATITNRCKPTALDPQKGPTGQTEIRAKCLVQNQPNTVDFDSAPPPYNRCPLYGQHTQRTVAMAALDATRDPGPRQGPARALTNNNTAHHFENSRVRQNRRFALV